MHPDHPSVLGVEGEGVRVVQFLEGQPGFGGRFAYVELLADEVLHEVRVRLGPLDLLCERPEVLDRAEARVRLLPAFRIGPLLALVQLIDHREEPVVVVSLRIVPAVYYAFGFVVLEVVNVLSDRAGCGRHEDHRLFPGCNAVRDDVIQRPAILPLVDLVHQSTVHIQTVEAVAVAGQWFEGAVVLIEGQLTDEGADPLRQARRFLDHPLRFVPDDLCLVSLCGHCVDLRAGFTVCGEHVVPDDRREQAFSVLLGHDQEDGLILSETVLIDKAEGSREQRLLPEFEAYHLAAVFSLRVPAVVLGEFEDVVRPGRAVVILVRVPDLIGEMCVQLPDLRAGDLLAALDLLPVFEDRAVCLRIASEVHSPSRPITNASKPSSCCFCWLSCGSMSCSCLMIFWYEAFMVLYVWPCGLARS